MSGKEDSPPTTSRFSKTYCFSSLTMPLVRKCGLGFLRHPHNTSSPFFQTYFLFWNNPFFQTRWPLWLFGITLGGWGEEKSFHILSTRPNSPQQVQVLFCYGTVVHRNSSFTWEFFRNHSTRLLSIARVSFLQLDYKLWAQGWGLIFTRMLPCWISTFLFKWPSKQMGWRRSKPQWTTVGSGLEFKFRNSVHWVPSHLYQSWISSVALDESFLLTSQWQSPHP